MKFALVIFETDESRRRIQADRAAYRKEYEGWIGDLAAAGKLVGGDALETEHTAPATVRTAADGTTTVTDAPAHTGEETLGGWFVVEVADRAEALELARSLPTPETVEVRPILESA
ncbi:YciI family protein [Kitasatospora cineracea]|uniref:YCII-related domain-containing protein n=1 Tax=Kitasatospora cineracea TaxID=88074 RepID=A0A8G1UMT9_9ACTN|nr:YciI family protein [Kitasatospora cineracea]ROR46928.1 YCII-related domain-containing protein [Kitasatospora cineracea]